MEQPAMLFESIIQELHALADAEVQASQHYFGSCPEKALGIRIPELRRIAKGKRDHTLAAQLWSTGIHEARILASLVEDVRQVTPQQMDAWVEDFDSWDVCDQVTGNLFDRTPYAVEKALAWSARPEEFVRRAGFALMATLAVHSRTMQDADYLVFFPIMEEYASDNRNFVRKAINWALRQIGKRSPMLMEQSIAAANRIAKIDSASARWIAADALRELTAKAKMNKGLQSPQCLDRQPDIPGSTSYTQEEKEC